MGSLDWLDDTRRGRATRILAVLRETGDVTRAQIARTLQEAAVKWATPQAVSALVMWLEARALVASRLDEELSAAAGKVIRRYCITEAGVRAMAMREPS